jgi:hypothetical protein
MDVTYEIFAVITAACLLGIGLWRWWSSVNGDKR